MDKNISTAIKISREQTVVSFATALTALVIIATIVIIIKTELSQRVTQSLRKTMGKSYFTIEELSRSDTARRLGIDNTPTPSARMALQALIDNVLDPLREEYGSYIKVHSGYRSQAVNAAVGGVSSSQHLTGEAADIDSGSVTGNRKLFALLVRQGKFDQLIWEKGGDWIHVSYRVGGNNRLSMLSYNGSSYTNINSSWQTAIA